VILANAADVQNRRGHETDPNDSRRLAHLLRHGMIRPSFIPPLAIRELRDLTRRRRQLIGENSRERNRVQKVLEDANVKLGTCGRTSSVYPAASCSRHCSMDI
jgi:transposase